tara:strand:+ start:462 stop:953 length:492 start_codon:yes stop_codon:yes gene_type:complete
MAKLNFKIYTCGFTKWSALPFFEYLKQKNITALVDIRRFPNSQLAGFTKQNNFRYFLKELSNCTYLHFESLAPNAEDFKKYRNKDISWEVFASRYNKKINSVDSKYEIERLISIAKNENVMVLCSEEHYEFCHRTLLTDYLKQIDDNLIILHVNRNRVAKESR